jgi:hypothetical protein
MAGYYILTARAPTATFGIAVEVTQTLTSISISPATATVVQGAQQQFTAAGFDQFHRAMAFAPTITWGTSSGTINTAGLFTAPSTGTACTVSAKSGAVTGTAAVTLKSNSVIPQPTPQPTPQPPPQPTGLAALVASLDADGSISRNDMIEILQTAAAQGTLTAANFSELKTILNQASALNMPGYVQSLASDVIYGNAANATYQGHSLGNLAVGSSSVVLTDLIDKWFYGTDLPTLTDSSLVYRSVSGSLFPHTPSNNDEYQGELGDCYFISSLGTLADSNPQAVENMFINNGDGTYTVRFYTGTYGASYNYSTGSISDGFSNGVGTPEYVTVNAMLPTTGYGMLVYADYGAMYNNAANALWIPLAEKAYAQWDQTGQEGRSGVNAYGEIQGGWMATVYAQVLGHNATDYIMSATSQQAAITALSNKEAVTIGTDNFSGTLYGLYADHAYAIIGYNASTEKFTLYNPWGFDQPGQLSWSQLQAATGEMCVASTAGLTSIFGGGVQVGTSLKISSCAGLSDAAGGSAAVESAASTSSLFSPAPAAAPAGQHFAGNASQRLFAAWGASWTPRSRLTPLAGTSRDLLPAASVDATLAADGLLPQSELCVALV